MKMSSCDMNQHPYGMTALQAAALLATPLCQPQPVFFSMQLYMLSFDYKGRET